MATANAISYGNTYPIPAGYQATSFVVKATTLTATMATGDILKIAKIQAKGISVIDAFVQSADLDTNATPLVVFSLQISDGTTTKTIIHQSTVGQAGGFIRPTKANSSEDGIGFVTDNDNYALQILFDTGAATAAAVIMRVGITLDGFYLSGEVTE